MKNSFGLTLIETLIVLVIVTGVLVPVYPSVQKQFELQQLKQEIEKLAVFLELARQESVLKRESLQVRLYSNGFNDGYSIREGVNAIGRYYLPNGITMYQNMTDSNGVIQFLHQGGVRPHGGTITLVSKSGLRYHVLVHPFSGIIEVRYSEPEEL